MKFVCFGGGNALPKVVLEELKKRPVEITSVTSMVDSGGSTGQLRRDFNVLPPGDIRRHILALSGAPEWKKALWKFRFGHEEFDGGHKGHNFANIFIVGLECALKDYGKALDFVHEFMEVKGRCMPATTDKVQLCALLENGKEIVGEDEIDVPKNHDSAIKIKEVYLKPKARAYPPVLDAIKGADAISLGPGDFYSSIIPCLLPEGIKAAIQKSHAKKILICPAMTKSGETNGFSVQDFVAITEKYLGCSLDYALFNTNIPGKDIVAKYREREKESGLLEPVSLGNASGKKFAGLNLLAEGDAVEYDSKKVVDALIKLAEK